MCKKLLFFGLENGCEEKVKLGIINEGGRLREQATNLFYRNNIVVIIMIKLVLVLDIINLLFDLELDVFQIILLSVDLRESYKKGEPKE